jgi:hypothetical protein
MANKVLNPTVALARNAFNQVLKNDIMTNKTTSPMTPSNPIIINSSIITCDKVLTIGGKNVF